MFNISVCFVSMKKHTLSSNEKIYLERLHRSTKDVYEKDRIKAVLLRSENWSLGQIAQALRIHETTVSIYLKEYLLGKINIKSGGSESFLSAEQTDMLISHLHTHTYQAVHEIILYVREKWSILYSISGMNQWLHRHGFNYKKPKGRPYKADRALQEKFVAYYNELKSSLPVNEVLYFIDSVHPTQSTKLAYGWIKKGKNRLIETTASRTRLNIVGALKLNDLGHPLIKRYKTINAESIMDYLACLRQKHPFEHKIHIILDQAGYHRDKSVIDSASQLNIELHFLPPYSPNLNPIERLWKVMNEKARNNRFFKSAKDFKSSIIHFFENTLPQLSDILSTRITDNFELI